MIRYEEKKWKHTIINYMWYNILFAHWLFVGGYT